MRKNAAHNAEYRGGYANSCTAQWGKLGGHIDNVILSNLHQSIIGIYGSLFIVIGKLSKKRRRNIWKIPFLGGGVGVGVSEGSFSICYNDTFKMHKKPF